MKMSDLWKMNLVGGVISGWEGYTMLWRARITEICRNSESVRLTLGDMEESSTMDENHKWTPRTDEPKPMSFPLDQFFDAATEGGYATSIPYLGKFVIKPIEDPQ